MTDGQRYTGLLSALNGDELGSTREFSPEWMPGMGLGATAEATRWAYKGWLLEAYAAFPTPPKRRRGQPTKPERFSNDAKRAYLLYHVTHLIRQNLGVGPTATIEMPLMELIELTEKLVRTNGLFDKPKATNKKYASIKQGREILGIDEFWRGPPPESLFND